MWRKSLTRRWWCLTRRHLWFFIHDWLARRICFACASLFPVIFWWCRSMYQGILPSPLCHVILCWVEEVNLYIYLLHLNTDLLTYNSVQVNRIELFLAFTCLVLCLYFSWWTESANQEIGSRSLETRCSYFSFTTKARHSRQSVATDCYLVWFFKLNE